jgi:hypothetical protein
MCVCRLKRWAGGSYASLTWLQHFFTQNFHAVKFYIFVLLKSATKKEQYNTCGAFQAEQLCNRIFIQIETSAFTLVGSCTQKSYTLTYTMVEALNLM